MVRVNWTDQALDDVENIANFIEKDSAKYANIQVLRFFDKVKILETHPHTGRIVPEINRDYLRELIQGNYRIIYRIVTDNLIDIITIHHSRRLLGNNSVFE
jgi:addiction module RelE/StbE family toxin